MIEGEKLEGQRSKGGSEPVVSAMKRLRLYGNSDVEELRSELGRLLKLNDALQKRLATSCVAAARLRFQKDLLDRQLLIALGGEQRPDVGWPQLSPRSRKALTREEIRKIVGAPTVLPPDILTELLEGPKRGRPRKDSIAYVQGNPIREHVKFWKRFDAAREAGEGTIALRQPLQDYLDAMVGLDLSRVDKLKIVRWLNPNLIKLGLMIGLRDSEWLGFEVHGKSKMGSLYLYGKQAGERVFRALGRAFQPLEVRLPKLRGILGRVER